VNKIFLQLCTTSLNENRSVACIGRWKEKNLSTDLDTERSLIIQERIHTNPVHMYIKDKYIYILMNTQNLHLGIMLSIHNYSHR
jgi:hypothetical protein